MSKELPTYIKVHGCMYRRADWYAEGQLTEDVMNTSAVSLEKAATALQKAATHFQRIGRNFGKSDKLKSFDDVQTYLGALTRGEDILDPIKMTEDLWEAVKTLRRGLDGLDAVYGHIETGVPEGVE